MSTEGRFWAFRGLAGVLAVVAVLILTELVLRLIGYQPFQAGSLPIATDPPGGIFRTDTTTGFGLKPGTFDVALADGYTFSATHNPEGYRITYSADSPHAPSKTVLVLGGSYTYGWSLNNRETFLWQVQQQFPQLKVVNMAVPAYGTLQSYRQLKQALQTHNAPDMVIYVYAGFHDMRNVDSRMWSKTLAPYNRLGPLDRPVANWNDGSMEVTMQPLEYESWPLQNHLALVNAVEDWSNERELDGLQATEVSQALIDSMQNLSAAFNSRFVVATIVTDERSEKVTAHCSAKGIEWFDMTVDTRLPLMTNLPHDSHPSAKANGEYAEKVVLYLRETLK